MSSKKQPLVILTGPTAVGKTALSVQLAKAIHGEIISADSMQVYRRMDVGSAKVTIEEMEGIPHHLIDVLDPKEEFNVVKFQQMAKDAMSHIYEKGKIPIVVGGTGFYIQALLYDINFQEDPGDTRIREELEALGEANGNLVLHEMLKEVDPVSALEIHPNNQKRVIRAIEYYRLNGTPISKHNETERKKESPYDFHYYVLNRERSVLYGRIDQRVDLMMEQGLVEEVQMLQDAGCEKGMTSMQGLGYKEILDYLEGNCTLEEAVYILKRDTRHFAKRQLTWFRRERDVEWLQLEDFANDRKQVLDYMVNCILKKEEV